MEDFRHADDARLAAALAVALLAATLAASGLSGKSRCAPLRLPRHVVDLNAAPAGEMETVPGIGPVLAQRIVAARRERPFASLADLRRVGGIGASTLARLQGFVRVQEP
jgi:DNA uptake protein ComE-like DNA-binding protein